FGVVTDQQAARKAGEALGTYHRKAANYPKWMKGKSDKRLKEIRAAHVRQLSGWNKIKNAARGKTRESAGGRAADKSMSSVIGISRAAKEIAKKPNKTPFKVGHKLLTKARGQMETDGGQAASSLIKGTKEAAVTTAVLVSNPSQGGIRLRQHIISRGTSSLSRGMERTR